MPIHSRWKVPLAVCSFQKYLFGSQTAQLPDKIVYYDAEQSETHRLSFNEFRSLSQQLAAGLRKAGLKPGDRVLLYSGNNLFYPVVFLGVLIAGGIFTGANPGLVTGELAYHWQNSEAKFLLCAEASLQTGLDAAKSIGMSEDSVFVFDDNLLTGSGKSRLGISNWKSLVGSKEEGEKLQWYEPDDPKDAVCCLNYSSGTTGLPKGVMITHFNYVANAIQVKHLGELSAKVKETNKASWLCSIPMYHAMGQTIFIASAPKRQIPTYIMKKFDFVKFLQYTERYRITDLVMVPPIVVALAKSPLTRRCDLSSVTDISSAAAPLRGDVITEAEAIWPQGDRKMRQGWGMTEVTCSLLGWDPNSTPIPDSVGELNANCRAKIMDHEDKEVSPGERGEIWVQAPNVMKGYWHNEAATKEIFVDSHDERWMKTGDIAYVNADGYFFIVDRIKELIKVKGNQVAPAELEAVLLEHPSISDAAVIGVAINGEEVPRAYVVLSKGTTADAKEIQTWTAKRVTRHKRILGGICFIDAIPKNPSGKILRKFLRDRAKAEVKQQDGLATESVL